MGWGCLELPLEAGAHRVEPPPICPCGLCGISMKSHFSKKLLQLFFFLMEILSLQLGFECQLCPCEMKSWRDPVVPRQAGLSEGWAGLFWGPQTPNLPQKPSQLRAGASWSFFSCGKKRREMAQSGEIIPDLRENNSVCPGGVPGVLSLGLAGSAEGGLIPEGFFP